MLGRASISHPVYSSRTTMSPGLSGCGSRWYTASKANLASSGPPGRGNGVEWSSVCHETFGSSFWIASKGPSIWIRRGESGCGGWERCGGCWWQGGM